MLWTCFKGNEEFGERSLFFNLHKNKNIHYMDCCCWVFALETKCRYFSTGCIAFVRETHTFKGKLSLSVALSSKRDCRNCCSTDPNGLVRSSNWLCQCPDGALRKSSKGRVSSFCLTSHHLGHLSLSSSSKDSLPDESNSIGSASTSSQPPVLKAQQVLMRYGVGHSASMTSDSQPQRKLQNSVCSATPLSPYEN